MFRHVTFRALHALHVNWAVIETSLQGWVW
jgi:hypothetical protein